VVGDLEDLDLGQASHQERRVDLLLDVAGEEEPVAGDRAEEDDRDVVDPGSAVGWRLGDAPGVRPQDPQLDVVDRETVTGHEDAALDPACREGGVEGDVAGARPDHPGLEHALHPVAAEEAHQPGGVILMGVAEDDDVDAAIPGRQVLVEGDEDAARVGPTVDEEAGATPALEQDRVALPDVEDGQPGDAVGSMDDRDRERDDRDGQATGEGTLDPPS
jgi:hypothetical protein